MRLFENAHYEFIGKAPLTKAVCLAVLLFAILPGLMLQITGKNWFNWGVDFTGGTLVQVKFRQTTTTADVRAVVEPVSPNAQISEFGGENEFLIRIATMTTGATGAGDPVDRALKARFGDVYTIERVEAVGPKVGNELRTKATIAVLLSFAATLIYLAFRLEWTFGVAAILATINDILFTIGVIAVFRLEVSLTTIAALLTIIGYSLNDKIVVFDRVRENLKSARREDFVALLNRSINETLPRTVMTGGSVIAVLAVLFLVGGIAIRDFALIMFLGIVVGTFSSMFVAPIVLVEFDRRRRSKGKTNTTRTARVGAAV